MALRGVKMWSDEFIKQLEGKYVPFKWDGQDKAIQIAVRPIQLFEIVHPESAKDLVWTTLFGDMNGAKGITHQEPHRKWVWAIRKILGAEALPDTWDTSKVLPVIKENLEIVSLGIKKDYWKDGNEML